MHRALWVGALCGLVCFSCSNGSGGNGSGVNADDGGGGGSSGAGSGGVSGSSGGSGSTAMSLIGTWLVNLGALGGTTGGPSTTVTIGQDSLTVTSPSFTLTAVRSGSSEAYSVTSEGVVLTANQTAAAFDTGIVPFNLGGTWAMTIVQGTSMQATCTLSVSSAEVDGACTYTQGGPFFRFTTTKMSSAASALGDFGGKWMNTWTWLYQGGGTYMCELDFLGNAITTCAGKNGGTSGHPLEGITFTYDGASIASGAAQGWAEYSAMRQ